MRRNKYHPYARIHGYEKKKEDEEVDPDGDPTTINPRSKNFICQKCGEVIPNTRGLTRHYQTCVLDKRREPTYAIRKTRKKRKS